MRTALCELLGIRFPVVLAGMAGGPTTPELVGAVSRGGGLGTFGLNGMSETAVRDQVRAARRLAEGAPIAANVLLASPTPSTTNADAMAKHMEPVRRRFDLSSTPLPSTAASPVSLLQAALEEGVTAVSVGLGDPEPVIQMARDAGVPVLAMITSVEEARLVVSRGANVVVAQGWEAGGHRSTFLHDPETPPQVGTVSLVPQVVDAVDVPVVAAGGITDGRGLAAALCLGASGAQLGTRFLGTRQAGIRDGYRAALLGSCDGDTRIIRAVSGRPARGIPNAIVAHLEAAPGTMGWPRQSAAWSDVRAAAAAADDPEYYPLWSGQNASGIPRIADDAETLPARLVDEARAALHNA